MHSSRFFRIKLIARLILKCEISGSHTIFDQSLLLSTIVLNDKAEKPSVCLSVRHAGNSVVSAWIDVGLGLCSAVVSGMLTHV